MRENNKPIFLKDYNFSYQEREKIKAVDHFFIELEIKRPILFKEYEQIKLKINNSLKRKEYEKLFELLADFDTDDGFGVLRYFSEMKRISIIVNIMMMEKEMNLPYFCNAVSDFDELLFQYNKLILYMRRLEMKLPIDLQREFFDYIEYNNISGVAIYTIAQSELFAKDIQIGCTYYDGLKVKEQGMFYLRLLLEKYPGREEILLRLADWCIEQRDIQNAQLYLEGIKQPSEMVQSLLKELKGVTIHE